MAVNRVISAPATLVQKTTSLDHAAGIGARARTASATPQRRNSSIVRAEVVFARGRTAETVVRGSTTVHPIPWWCSSIATARPTGPPPTTTTGTSRRTSST